MQREHADRLLAALRALAESGAGALAALVHEEAKAGRLLLERDLARRESATLRNDASRLRDEASRYRKEYEWQRTDLEAARAECERLRRLVAEYEQAWDEGGGEAAPPPAAQLPDGHVWEGGESYVDEYVDEEEEERRRNDPGYYYGRVDG